MSQYSKGANFERRVKKHFEDDGWYVIRAAGSKGLFDLICFKAGMIFAIQVKLDGVLSRNEREQMAEWGRSHLIPVLLASRDGQEIMFETV